ncbi:MAG: DNA polymerase IV [Eubacteriales bacterium]|nr:DNA polymerase IV [Eubacteriales bacterium]
MSDRVILHSDLNNYYASVECLYNPALRNIPIVVGGDPELRHGIVLAKNYPAKAFGIVTGEALWQAKQKCPNLTVVKPNFELYLYYAHKVRAIYGDYTDQIEPFGLDEAWLDVGGTCHGGMTGERIATEIRRRTREELGLTASVGVSYNKIFAKLGSDMKKPDATTVITRANYQSKVWPLPAADLLYVGPATKRKLARLGIRTIGELARLDEQFLQDYLGKWGDVLSSFANGRDTSPVAVFGTSSAIKSIGNSTTTPRDLVNNEDIQLIFYVLSESVAMRLRQHHFKCQTVQIHVRDVDLTTYERQAKLSRPSNLSADIARLAMQLFVESYNWIRPVRSIGVRGSDLVAADTEIQLSFFENESQNLRRQQLEETIDLIRARFGNASVRRAITLQDRSLGRINPKDDHVIFPVGYFKNGPVG